MQLHFDNAIKELDYKIPEPEETVHWYIQKLAQQILSGSMTPSNGCATIYKLYVNLGYPDFLRKWDFLSGDMHPDKYYDLSPLEFNELVLKEAKELLSLQRPLKMNWKCWK